MRSTHLATYDVFDTLLTRAVGSPGSVFTLLGALSDVRRLTGCEPLRFAEVRRRAEQRARRGRPEVTLASIYSEVAVALGLDAPAAEALASAEVELELRLSRLVPLADTDLKEDPAQRKVAVSDMYLPTAAVRELLDRQGLLAHLDDVVVSCDHGASKWSGELFRVVQHREGAPVGAWTHVGDNRNSDHRVPRLLGLQTRHVTATALNRYEQLLEGASAATGGMSSLLAGASRLTRLSCTVPDEQRPVVDVVAGVAAPSLVAFTLWVLRSAKAAGLQRLYFLARDGELLHQLADELSRRLGLGIDCRYLYGSRSVYHRASLATVPLAEATWAWTSMYSASPFEVLVRVGLTDEEADQTLARLGLAASSRSPLTDGARTLITSDPATQERVQRAGADLLQRVHGYLRQEGLADDEPYGIVDIGWAGRMANALANALPPEAPELRRGYMFGYMKRSSGYRRPEVLEGYLFDEHRQQGYWSGFGHAYGPLETFTVADHGMTTDFVERDGRFEPVLASATNPTLESWPWQLCRETIHRFVNHLVLDPDLADVAADLRDPVAEVLTEFWEHPTLQEARAWGAYLYEDDMLARSRNELASPYRTRDVIGRAARRSYEGKRMWDQGSVMLTSRPLQPMARWGLAVIERRRDPAGPVGLISDRWQHRLQLLALCRELRRGSGTTGALSC